MFDRARAAAGLAWSVVVPVKPLHAAKSRLHPLPPEQRRELTLAMATDTVAAAAASLLVCQVVVVCDDPEVVTLTAAVGGRPIADEPGAGLNTALQHGAGAVRRDRPNCPVAALAADLPCLRPEELGAALSAAAKHRRALVTDRAGTGTTLLTAAPGAALRPSFGAGSRQRHLAVGAVELTVPQTPGLRLDVDTVADLAAATALGVGERTAAVLAGFRPASTGSA